MKKKGKKKGKKGKKKDGAKGTNITILLVFRILYLLLRALQMDLNSL